MQLTSGQQQALDGLCSFLGDDSTVTALLAGSAGTGKTFTTALLIKRIQELRLKAVIAAPTHKAARCLERALVGHGLINTSVITVARVLQLREIRDLDSGTEAFKPTDHIKPFAGDLLIVDEASMISQEHYEWIIKILKPKQKIIFIGDPAQLPPVDDGCLCEAFTSPDRSFTLGEVVRHAGPILELANATRRLNTGRPPYVNALGRESKIVAHPSREHWQKSFLEIIKQQESLENSDFARALCFTNANVSILNAVCRFERFGPSAPAFMVGETLLSHKAIPDPLGGTPLISSTTEMRVLQAEQHIGPICYDNSDWVEMASNGKRAYAKGEISVPEWRFWQLVVLLETGSKQRFNVLDPLDKDRWQRTQDRLRKYAFDFPAGSWERQEIFRIWFARRDQFGSVQPATALTIHKSQGSTFDRVWLHPDSDGFPHDRFAPRYNRLAYVGMTRAALELHVVAD